jgi:phospholipid-binding lipoprotein MlaA
MDFFIQRYMKLFVLIALLVSSSLVYSQEADDDFFAFEDEEFFEDEIADPFEPINRVVFAINDRLFRIFLSPVVKTYRIVPEAFRVSISNFYTNLTAPVSAVNALLQLDIPNAGSEISRFGLNSTLGILGLFDPATRWGFEEDREDLGQTLGHYGVGHGFYIVLPILSFSSLRDASGRLGNSYLNPINHIWDPELDDWIAFQGLDGINDLSFEIDNYISLYDSALDPYVFFRSAYVQNREGAVNQ